MNNFSILLEISSRDHSHLCPRQILGVRIGVKGLCSLQLEPNQGSKRLLVITETDGCFADGLTAATQCTVGHQTLRVEDYGKTAATFVDTQTGNSVRIAPVANLRQRAQDFVPEEPRHYFAQMTAYQIMPDDEMMLVQPVMLNVPIERIVSRPGIRASCEVCGEEIMNEREIQVNGSTLCRACIGESYYHLQFPNIFLEHHTAIGSGYSFKK